MAEVGDLCELFKKGLNGAPLSNIMVSFPNTFSDIPVAFVSGSLNLEKSLRRNGQAVSLSEELSKLEEVKSKMSAVIDLTKAASELRIDNCGVDEKEIKEEWSEKDEQLFNNRGQRIARTVTNGAFIDETVSRSSIPDDIDALLRAAEEEDEVIEQPVVSKIAQLKKAPVPEKKELLSKLSKRPPTSSPILGDIIERKTEPIVTEGSTFVEDDASKRVLMNEVKAAADKKVSKFKQLSRQ